MTSEPDQNKQLFFLMGMPRSGNTLFASLMNQNPEVVVTANSITLEIMKDLFLLKKTDVFQNYPDHKSLDNVLDSVYDVFYQDWPQRIIIDRGPVMTKENFKLMQKHYRRPFKCIVLLRDVMDVLASYMKWYTENPDSFVNRYGCKNDDEKLGMIMNDQGAVAKELKGIQNSFNHKDLCYYLKYDDLVTDPQKYIKEVYKFLEEPYYPHRFQNLQQININGLGYNDGATGKNMHTIRHEIKKEYNPYIERIPQRLKDKYGHIRF